MKTIGVIREYKQPADLRTPLTPNDCLDLIKRFPGIKIIVQASPFRCFSDDEYRKIGIEVREDVSEADILLGVKEVPYNQLIADKTYLFFSHTIKKQAVNKKMLREILRKNITLIDYETLVWQGGHRIIGFGRFAGIVGAHYAFLMWGLRNNSFSILPANKCKNMDAMYAQYEGLQLPPMKIVLCGDGRVAHGAMEFFKRLKIHHITPEQFLETEYDHPVYVQLRSEDYYAHKDGRGWDKSDFYKHAENYRSTFSPYNRSADVMINAVYWHSKLEPFFTLEEMKNNDFRIKIISDISCDVPGPIPSTVRSTTIAEPYYGFNPFINKETAPFEGQHIDVQAVGNLPCELPID
ncbi:MAG: alanine dehydrogenase, partial [Bacteroidia bacterium]|nr:alanine dehydrogenase [Bacteroidia bacterium]